MPRDVLLQINSPRVIDTKINKKGRYDKNGFIAVHDSGCSKCKTSFKLP